jgi:hypothetical protein
MSASATGVPTCCGQSCDHIEEEEAAQELKLIVPTYLANMPRKQSKTDDSPEFGNPYIPILVREAEGVRIVLGTHDYEDGEKPDIQIERRPNGWAIFLRSLGGGDPSGYVYFLDDGRSFLVPEFGYAINAGGIQVLAPHEDVPELDVPQLPPGGEENEIAPNVITRSV